MHICLSITALVGLLIAQTGAPRPVSAAQPIVSNDWLQQHLSDPAVRVIFTGSRAGYARGHIPGARLLSHEATLAEGHVLLAPDTLAAALTRAGAANDSHVVLYGDSPTTTGWIFMALASIGHGADVSMLEAVGIPASVYVVRTTTGSATPPTRSSSLEPEALTIFVRLPSA